jgi:alkyl hydroperoxide reductase subunit F
VKEIKRAAYRIAEGEGMHDIIIIGAGPAGISAGVYCARKMMDTLVITKDIGGQATWSWEVENYLGYQLISGVELVEHFREHLENFSVELVEGSSVSSLSQKAEGFSTVTENGEEFESRAVIVASGKLPRELEVPGEREFRGRGVAYCATCDAPLFRGKKVVVVGGGNSAIDAALQLSKIAEKTTMITIEDWLVGDEIRREQCLESANVEVLTSAEVTAIHGETFVKSIDITREGKEQSLEVEGVFVEIGSIPSTGFLAPVVELNELGEIVIDTNNHTNVPGLFAAGDVTNVIEKQIIIAAGEGAKAALTAYSWMMENGYLSEGRGVPAQK